METPPTIPATPAPLEYGARPRLSWISRHAKKLILLSLLIAIAAPLYWYRQPLKHRVLWLYWSHQAAAFQMPIAAVVIRIDDPAEAKRVASTNPSYDLVESARAMPNARAMYRPLPYRKLKQLDLRLLINDDEPVVFMGTLRRPDGAPRLVLVIGGGGTLDDIVKSTQVLMLPLPGWFDPIPQATPTSSGLADTLDIGGLSAHTRLKTGVADPLDPSHVSFEFDAVWPITINNNPNPWGSAGHGIIDAHLTKEDKLQFRVRSFSDTPSVHGSAKP